MGNPVRQPNHNFAPQLGLAYDPWKNGKTVFRAGIGLFYENGLWQNVFQDRGLRLSTGGFVAFPVVCFPGVDIPVVFADGSTNFVPPGGCPGALGNPVAIGNAGPVLAAFQQQFESTAAAVGSNAANPNSLANLIAGPSTLPTAAWPLAPNYQTPRSIQINAGVQRELRPGTVISADYLRNVSLHFLLAVDPNHTGDARFLDRNAALAAISATNGAFGCGPPLTGAAAIDCAIGNGATMVDYASFGLDSPTDLGLGRCGVALVGVDCAFPGINPAAGSIPFLSPIGRSVYNALQVKLLQRADHLAPGLEHLNLQVSYTLSRYVSPGGSNPSLSNPTNLAAYDQDFLNAALDNRSPLGFTGPSTLDRTHQLSIGAIADLPHAFRVSLVSHIFSALPMTLLVPNTGLGPGEIFRTDFTGDGTVQDLLPGTAVGSFGRGISAGSLNSVIQQYNSNVAGTLTPAGQALVAAGLFTQAQLLNMQGTAVAPTLPLAPPGEVGLGGLRTFDLKVGWAHTFQERIRVEPSVAIFNLFNFANFDLPSSMLTGLLTGQPGSVNGTTPADRTFNRVGLGTGVFALGAPRVCEFGLKITF
jgi:hypothetical protein